MIDFLYFTFGMFILSVAAVIGVCVAIVIHGLLDQHRKERLRRKYHPTPEETKEDEAAQLRTWKGRQSVRPAQGGSGTEPASPKVEPIPPCNRCGKPRQRREGAVIPSDPPKYLCSICHDMEQSLWLHKGMLPVSEFRDPANPLSEPHIATPPEVKDGTE